MIRVAICDDHQIVRAGFKQIFSSSDDFEVVAEAGTGREALDIARREICDVLLLDIAMPDQSGIDTLRTIRQGQPDLPVLILSGYPAQQYALNLFKMGANGYLNKECEADELMTAVRTVYQGAATSAPPWANCWRRALTAIRTPRCTPSCRTASSRCSCGWRAAPPCPISAWRCRSASRRSALTAPASWKKWACSPIRT
jgi:DNA-binding NarL/FixJ family response regulator